MVGLFSSPKKPSPILTTPIIPSKDPAIAEAASREVEALTKRKGMKSTILTGPEGLQTQPSVLSQKLGGD